jgi:hypothetical protein
MALMDPRKFLAWASSRGFTAFACRNPLFQGQGSLWGDSRLPAATPAKPYNLAQKFRDGRLELELTKPADLGQNKANLLEPPLRNGARSRVVLEMAGQGVQR